jgi:biopolymer transport protein ExbD
MHGGTATSAEPNLTPLLDLVLQLVMFFMLCANFVMEQVNESILLPKAQMARPMDRDDSQFLFLNVDKDGRLLVVGRNPLVGPVEVSGYLQREFADAQRRARPNAQGQAEVRTKVVIRAHEKAKYAHVYSLMKTCQSVGFRNLELRAIINMAGRS